MIKKNQPPIAWIARVAALGAILMLLGSVPAWAAKQPGMGILYPTGVLEHADGTTVSTSGSTTAGIQELINYCNTGYVDGYIVGGNASGGGGIVYNCSTSISLPAYQGFRLDTGSLTINFTSAIGANNGLIINSCMMTSLRIRGQIVYPGTGYAVSFDPTSKFPQDPSPACITDSSFQFTNVVASGSGSCVLFQTSSVGNSTFYFNAITGGAYGINMTCGSFMQNKVTCLNMNGQTNTQVLAFSNDRNNEWNIFSTANGQTQTGIDTAGEDDIWTGSIANSGRAALVLEANAKGNQFHMMQLVGSITNSATTPTNYVCIDPNAGSGQTQLGFSCGTPAMPGSGAYMTNSKTYMVEVVILTAGTVSAWSRKDPFGTVQAFTTGLKAGQTFLLTPGEAVAFTYTAAPTWKWRAVN